jgi:hypothetical protein
MRFFGARQVRIFGERMRPCCLRRGGAVFRSPPSRGGSFSPREKEGMERRKAHRSDRTLRGHGRTLRSVRSPRGAPLAASYASSSPTCCCRAALSAQLLACSKLPRSRPSRPPSASSLQGPVVVPGGAPAPPGCVAANHARGRRTPASGFKARDRPGTVFKG